MLCTMNVSTVPYTIYVTTMLCTIKIANMPYTMYHYASIMLHITTMLHVYAYHVSACCYDTKNIQLTYISLYHRSPFRL